jgi:hypothetical protein
MLGKYNVLVKFGDSIPSEAQAMALMALEKNLRILTKLDVRVFKELKQDDSKLRRLMTVEQRNKL